MEWKTSTTPIAYPEAVSFMEQRVAAIRAGSEQEMVWLLEHPPLYTAGTSARAEDLLDATRFPVYPTGRGGQYTYHGPGQRVAYVMLDLKKRYAPKPPDIRQFVCNLEHWLISALAEFGVKGERRKGRVGIWVAEANGRESKIAALGIRVRQGITYHGIALNRAPDLAHFSGIVPCGIQGHGVTSLKALGVEVTPESCDQVLRRYFEQIFK